MNESHTLSFTHRKAVPSQSQAPQQSLSQNPLPQPGLNTVSNPTPNPVPKLLSKPSKILMWYPTPCQWFPHCCSKPWHKTLTQSLSEAPTRPNANPCPRTLCQTPCQPLSLSPSQTLSQTLSHNPKLPNQPWAPNLVQRLRVEVVLKTKRKD